MSHRRSPHVPSHTCITYDAVNAAYVDARKRLRVSQPKGEWKPEDIATVGELLLDMSIQLSRTWVEIWDIFKIKFYPIIVKLFNELIWTTLKSFQISVIKSRLIWFSIRFPCIRVFLLQLIIKNLLENIQFVAFYIRNNCIEIDDKKNVSHF